MKGKDERAVPLARMKRIAAALLLATLALLVFSDVMAARTGWAGWEWIRSFSEAAAVGALADWFAVVALFRRPLGLPIPHTAIIPANRDRIAENLADFVRENFLDPATLLPRLASFDPAARIAGYISDPEQVRRMSDGAGKLLLDTLEWFEDGKLQGEIGSALAEALRRSDIHEAAAQALGSLVRDGMHQELLDRLLAQLGRFVSTPDLKSSISAMLANLLAREYPKVNYMLGKMTRVGEKTDDVAEKIANSLVDELNGILCDAQHPLRQIYDRKFMEFVGRMHADPDLAAKIGRLRDAAIDSDAFRNAVASVSNRMLSWLRSDLNREDSVVVAQLRDLLAGFAQRLASDDSLARAINEHVQSTASRLIQDFRFDIAGHISGTIKSWDETRFTTEVELAIGRDLQFIRFNGTLVGGAMGLLLHLLLSAAHLAIH